MGRQRGVKRECVPDGRMTVCKCPKCGGKHKLYLNFTGRGTPRCFCHQCRYLFSRGIIDNDYLPDECGPRDIGYANLPPQPSHWQITPTFNKAKTF